MMCRFSAAFPNGIVVLQGDSTNPGEGKATATCQKNEPQHLLDYNKYDCCDDHDTAANGKDHKEIKKQLFQRSTPSYGLHGGHGTYLRNLHR